MLEEDVSSQDYCVCGHLRAWHNPSTAIFEHDPCSLCECRGFERPMRRLLLQSAEPPFNIIIQRRDQQQ